MCLQCVEQALPVKKRVFWVWEGRTNRRNLETYTWCYVQNTWTTWNRVASGTSADPGFAPFSAPNIASDPNAQPQQGQGVAVPKPSYNAAGGIQPNPGPPITVVNTTGDHRVLWEDGQVAVIYAKDYVPGLPRSKTRDTIPAVLAAPIDPGLVTPPGPGQAYKFVKVVLKDLLANPVQLPAAPKPQMPTRLPVSPDQFRPVTPKVAQSGKFKGTVIPDFPHTCAACGGPYYQGMFDSVHPTPDGRCPKGAPKRKGR
jgi:hypothetical protein